MPIRFQCEECGHQLAVADPLAGRQGRCPSCSAVVQVPMVTPRQASEMSGAQGAASGHGDAAPQPRSRGLRRGRLTRSEDSPFSADVISAIAGARPWVLLIAILGFLVVALEIAGFAFVLVTAMQSEGGASPGLPEFGGMALGAVILFGVSFLLLRYARAIRLFTRDPKEAHLAAALRAQTAYWRLTGVLVLVGLALAVLAVAFMVLSF